MGICGDCRLLSEQERYIFCGYGKAEVRARGNSEACRGAVGPGALSPVADQSGVDARLWADLYSEGGSATPKAKWASQTGDSTRGQVSDWQLDDQVPDVSLNCSACPSGNRPLNWQTRVQRLVLEGGSIDTNGRDSAATEECC